MNLMGVDYIVIGAITQYGTTEDTGGFGGFVSSKRVANMAVDVRVADVENGTMAFAESVAVQADGSRAFAVEDVGARVRDDDAQLLGRVMRMAAREITFLVVSNVYPIRVAARTSDTQLILNYGDGLLVNGDALHIYEEGETFIDPATGEVLGSTETLVARVEITSTENRFSRAQILSEYSPITTGMVAKLVYVDPRNKDNKGRKIRR